MTTERTTVCVSVCSDIDGLVEAVEHEFASSSLAAHYCLNLRELPLCSDEMPEADLLLADPGKVAPLLDSVKGLKWLQSTWAGINALANTNRRDYTCTKLGGCFGAQMAEYVIGALLSSLWFQAHDYQAKSEWAPEPFKQRQRLRDMRLACLGTGEIATEIAQRAKAFGMKTLGFNTRIRDCTGFDEVSLDLAHVLRSADVIVNVLPSTSQTRGLLDGGVLEACGEGKVFINVGRGDVVTEESLLQAFEKGWLSRAALDVFATEPLPPSSQLWTHPSVRVTPHISAVTYPSDAAKLFVENLGLFLEGKQLRYVVSLDKGY
eukprot:TRINITY_DN5003_c0_g1_i3.p1 TRINITY_DN5003_c0_g1~~TRINITY_DN5003_c0_g1_i3.p1  ORF type:complete len:350 (-),score=65.97 TRINITY_DN5003_c0_g1_i3:58-1017(-)